MEKCEEKYNEDEKITSENSKFANLCLTAIGSSMTFLVGYYFTVMNPWVPTLKALYNQTHMDRYNSTLPETTWVTLLAFSTSSIIVGAFIGAMTTKSWLSCMSPKRLLQAIHVLNIIGVLVIALGAGLSGSYEAFIIGRFITGYPLGSCYVFIPAMISEISEISKQGLWQSIFAGTVSVGFLLGALLGHPNIMGNFNLWPVLFGIGILPSIIFLVASVKIPESPYYLVRAGLMQQAKSTLTKLRTNSEENTSKNIQKELEKIEKEINEGGTNSIGIRQIISTIQYRNQLLGVLVLLANIMLCGINNILFYSSLAFTEAGMTEGTAAYANVGIFGLQLITVFIGSKLIERFGGVRMLMAANITAIFSLILFTFTLALRHLSPDFMPYLSILAIGLFVATFAGGINIATFVVIAEITIEPTRVTCMAYGNFVLWLTSWLVGFLPPYLQLGLGNFAMVPWIICSILGLLYMVIGLPNTKGKTPAQIQRRLSSKISLSSMR